jgi:hypothetical protein
MGLTYSEIALINCDILLQSVKLPKYHPNIINWIYELGLDTKERDISTLIILLSIKYLLDRKLLNLTKDRNKIMFNPKTTIPAIDIPPSVERKLIYAFDFDHQVDTVIGILVSNDLAIMQPYKKIVRIVEDYLRDKNIIGETRIRMKYESKEILKPLIEWLNTTDEARGLYANISTILCLLYHQEKGM